MYLFQLVENLFVPEWSVILNKLVEWMIQWLVHVTWRKSHCKYIILIMMLAITVSYLVADNSFCQYRYKAGLPIQISCQQMKPQKHCTDAALLYVWHFFYMLSKWPIPGDFSVSLIYHMIHHIGSLSNNRSVSHCGKCPRRDRLWKHQLHHVCPKDGPITALDKEPTPSLYIQLWSPKRHSCSLPHEDFSSAPRLCCPKMIRFSLLALLQQRGPNPLSHGIFLRGGILWTRSLLSLHHFCYLICRPSIQACERAKQQCGVDGVGLRLSWGL